MPHQPVLVEEVVEHLVRDPNGIYLDATLGAGGHAKGILEKLGDSGKLIGIDCDEQIIHVAKEHLKKFGEKVEIIHGHYDEARELLSQGGISRVDGVLLDLGVSSLQLDTSERGFSFRKEGPLDMRMDLTERTTATEVINQFSEKKLEEIFRDYGEEGNARKIAQAIVQRRRREKIVTTTELADLVSHAIPKYFSRIHPATKVFQALRIFVNQELSRLDRFLEIFPSLLRSQGRAAIISYHSLEDRRVKQRFRQGKSEGWISWITQKPIRPAEQEIRNNPRARSARLRVAEVIS